MGEMHSGRVLLGFLRLRDWADWSCTCSGVESRSRDKSSLNSSLRRPRRCLLSSRLRLKASIVYPKAVVSIMRILTHIQSYVVEIHCGQGRQRIQWLADSAVHRIDPNYGQSVGAVVQLKLADGTVLNANAAISDTLADAAEVWVVLKGGLHVDEVEDKVRGEEAKSPAKSSTTRSLRSTSKSKK